jgi:prepilin-type N-terminal cleavage/methylation domain-containing protein
MLTPTTERSRCLLGCAVFEPTNPRAARVHIARAREEETTKPWTVRSTTRRGFSLVELAVTVTLAGILSSLAVATLWDVAQKNRVTGGAQALAGALRRARALAMGSHSRVRIETSAAGITWSSCPSRYGAPACVINATWTKESSATSPFGPLGDFAGVEIASPVTTLVFGPSGFPETAGIYTWSLHHRQPQAMKFVIVTAGGEVRVQ